MVCSSSFHFFLIVLYFVQLRSVVPGWRACFRNFRDFCDYRFDLDKTTTSILLKHEITIRWAFHRSKIHQTSLLNFNQIFSTLWCFVSPLLINKMLMAYKSIISHAVKSICNQLSPPLVNLSVSYLKSHSIYGEFLKQIVNLSLLLNVNKQLARYFLFALQNKKISQANSSKQKYSKKINCWEILINCCYCNDSHIKYRVLNFEEFFVTRGDGVRVRFRDIPARMVYEYQRHKLFFEAKFQFLIIDIKSWKWGVLKLSVSTLPTGRRCVHVDRYAFKFHGLCMFPCSSGQNAAEISWTAPRNWTWLGLRLTYRKFTVSYFASS